MGYISEIKSLASLGYLLLASAITRILAALVVLAALWIGVFWAVQLP